PPPHLLFNCYSDRRAIHSFPTRRSSDLFAAGELDATVDRHPGGNPGPLRPGGAAPAPDPSRAPGEATRDSRAPLLQDGILQSDGDRKSTRLNSSHVAISYAVFCLKKKTN